MRTGGLFRVIRGNISWRERKSDGVGKFNTGWIMSFLLLLAMRALLLDTSGRCVEIMEHCPTQGPRSWDIYPHPCTLGGGCFPRCRLSGCFSALCAEAERVRTVDENCLVQSFWCTVSGAFIANRTCNWKIGVLIIDSKWAPDGICYKYNLNQKASLSKTQ